MTVARSMLRAAANGGPPPEIVGYVTAGVYFPADQMEYDLTGLDIQSGDLLVCFASRYNSNSLIPTGFTTVYSGGNTTYGARYCGYKIADGTEGIIYSPTNTTYAAGMMIALRGVVYADADYALTSVNPPATTNDAGGISIIIAGDSHTSSNSWDSSVTPPANYTLLGQVSQQGYDGAYFYSTVRAYTREDIPANEDPGSFTGWSYLDTYYSATFATNPA